MKTYSVKQIAESLGTNPETVRRWIRGGKLKAVQVSRKDGNLVSESDLQKFLEKHPRYLAKMPMGVVAAIAPTIGLVTMAGNLMAGVIMSYYKEQKQNVTRVKLEDLKAFLNGRLEKMNQALIQKEKLIKQTQAEIEALQEQVRQYELLLQHEDLMKKTITQMETTDKMMED